MTSEQKNDLYKAMQDLNAKMYIKQRDEEIVDALRAKFGHANQ